METLEELKSRHSKEKKDLQNRITSKKKAATKKSRKGVNAECDELEISLRLRHERELVAANGEEPVPDIDDVPELDDDSEENRTTEEPVNGITNGVKKVTFDSNVGDTASDTTSVGGGAPEKKRNRQKERLARRAAEQEAEAAIAEAEALKMPNWKKQERTGMLKAFIENGLVEEEIRPDGHCLFSAVADQLKQVGVPLGGSDEEGYKITRKAAADYVESHPDDFAGFMEEPLKIHTYKIRETAEWGGHIEVTALARSYGVEINVVQNTRIDRFEPEEAAARDTKRIWLAYYLHGYGLGEHYNSLRRAP